MTQIPAFSLHDQNGRVVTPATFKGKYVVLYFYPKADTPGCTLQACGLRDNIKTIQALGATVVGVSPDDVKDLHKFKEKHDLNFTLLADPDTNLIKAMGIWKEKTFMGRRYMGVERTTFLIDGAGQIIKTYEKVNPVTHADNIIMDLKQIVMPAPPARTTEMLIGKSIIAKPKSKLLSVLKSPFERQATPQKNVKVTKTLEKKTTAVKPATRKVVAKTVSTKKSIAKKPASKRAPAKKK